MAPRHAYLSQPAETINFSAPRPGCAKTLDQLSRGGYPLQVRTVKTIRIKVKPNARSSGLEELSDGTWLARLLAPPVDGKANEELVRLIAERFRVRKAQVSIKSGASGRLKHVQITDG
jgi:uncharacterized protein